jgi:D-sedoheptulose 7-phosphate isomerase
LSTDTSALTCISNDYSFDEICARQVAGLGRPGDVLIVISTSGNSRNVVRTIEGAKKIGLTTVSFLGCDAGQLLALCSYSIAVPSRVNARVQGCYILIGHTLFGLIKGQLGII